MPQIPEQDKQTTQTDNIVIPKPQINFGAQIGTLNNLFGVFANKLLDRQIQDDGENEEIKKGINQAQRNQKSSQSNSQTLENNLNNLIVKKIYSPDATPDGKGGYKPSTTGYWQPQFSQSTGMPVMSAITFVGTSYTGLDGSVITIPTITFEMVIISMKKGRNIEKTSITGRDSGSVKEYISANDWEIEIRAIVSASQNVVQDGSMDVFYQEGKYPEENMEKIDLLLNAHIAIKVICPYINKRGVNYLVIDDGVRIDQIEGEYEIQRLNIPCLSDSPLIISVAS